MYTIDTSIFVNGYDTNEVGNTLSRALLDVVRSRTIPLVMPELLLAEVAGALARTRGDLVAAYTFALALHRIPQISFVVLDAMLAESAAHLVAAHRLRGADSVYAAVALQYHTTLVSLDNEHLTRLAGFIPVLRPADALAELLSSSS